MSRHELIVESTPEPLTPVFSKGTANADGNIFWSRAGETPLKRYSPPALVRPTEFIFEPITPTASPKTFLGTEPSRALEAGKFERERDAFLKLKDSLLGQETYTGKFVAIHQGRIVGVGEDKRELAKNVYAQFGYVAIYIGKVERVRTAVEMPSPEGP